MCIDDALRRRGFRSWYERQLIEGHAYLVTVILTVLGMAIALEVVSYRDSLLNLFYLITFEFAGGLVCIFAWNRFRQLLGTAEALAEQAVCSHCHTYGRLTVLAGHRSDSTVTGRAMTVRCRGCTHQWQMG